MYRGVFYVDESAGVDYAALKKARLPRTTRQDQRAYAIGGEHMTLDDIVSEPVIVRVAADPEQVALVPIAQSRLNPDVSGIADAQLGLHNRPANLGTTIISASRR